jgi:hypothetical protein
MRKFLPLLALLLAIAVPTVLAQSGLPPWATVDANGQITFNPNGLQPTGAIMLPPRPAIRSCRSISATASSSASAA